MNTLESLFDFLWNLIFSNHRGHREHRELGSALQENGKNSRKKIGGLPSEMSSLRKIRVVHIVYSFGTGGLEKGIATLVRNAPPDVEHIILCLYRSGLSSRLLPQGTKVMEMNKKPGNSIRFVWKLAQTLKSLNPDVVHTRNFGGIDGILAAKIAGCRTVIQGEHGWEINDPLGRNPKRLLIRKLASFLVTEYTCVSRHLAYWLAHTLKVGKPVTQIYNGMDILGFRPDTTGRRVRKSLNIEPDDFVVGIVGRLDPIKDHATLFRAFEKVRGKSPVQCRLLVVGDGELRDELGHRAGEGVRFLGNRTDVPELMAAMDLFVLPSLNEGISNTILEAMAAGLPVIATGVGGNTELVDDKVTGFVFVPGNDKELAALVLQYVRDEELRTRHGRAGRKKIAQKFSIRNMVYSYHQVYRKAAQSC